MTGQNGILNQADKAKEETAKETAREKVAVEVLGSYRNDGNLDYGLLEDNLNNIEGIQGVPSPITKLPLTVTVDGYNVTIADTGDVTVGDENDNPPQTDITLDEAKDESMLDNPNNTTITIGEDTVTIPGGFKVTEDSGNTVDEGIVIEDRDNNQFVWIPVKEINDMVQCSTAGGECTIVLEGETISCTTHSNTNLVGKLYATTTGNKFTADTPNTTYDPDSGLREPAIVSNYDNLQEYLDIINRIIGTNYKSESNTLLTDMQNDFYNMAKSVEKYKGFYVGRYEVSKSNSNTAQSKANSIALTADDDISASMNGNTWYGLYAYGKTYTNSADSVVSSMIWGSQYDAMMRWMEENGDNVTSTNDDIKSTNNTTTGYEGDKDIIRKVYDLYGGKYEWTLEADSHVYRVYRGRLLREEQFT